MPTLLIIGATGQVGGQLLAQALADPGVTTVVAPTRRALAPHPKLHNPIIDFAHLPAQAPWWQADALLCALGSTLRQAGSHAAFYQIDHDMVIDSASLAHAAGTPVMVYNSSLGADPGARNFYLRVKGEVERDLGHVGFHSLSLVRPSLLIGGPRPDARPGEQAGIWLARTCAPLIPARYRAVPTATVASAMLAAARAARAGTHIIESNRLSDPLQE